MIFLANAYEVEIWEGGKKSHSLKINDATSTFRAIKLDELEDEVISIVEKIAKIQPQVSEIIKNNSQTLIQDLPKEDQDMLVELERLQKEMKKLNAEFIRILVHEWDKKIELIDSVGSNSLRYFIAAIRRAAFGQTDNRPGLEKKKIKQVKSKTKSPGKKSKKNSTGGVTRNKK
ncbi:MAG: hypothetical protein SH817_08605 [Leptospira sp.]|nr:hypothetical protein [Leptospira sp.]